MRLMETLSSPNIANGNRIISRLFTVLAQDNHIVQVKQMVQDS